ncbi:MAG TPA: class II glutamine amidotransferase [Usitatibacter sp.]|nr:class II glutamine amidotransferase [Usitatibacter sp.]
MCRVLAYLGEPLPLDTLLYAADNSLVRQSYAPRRLRMLNLAGFGIAAWDPDHPEPYTYHTPGLPAFDNNLRSMSRNVQASCVLAHVRGIPFGENPLVGPQFLHPFMYPGMRVALAHNGELHRFAEMRPALQRSLRPEIARLVRTNLDSEWIYAVFLSRLADPGADHSTGELADALVGTLEVLGHAREKAGIDSVSSVNLFVANGRNIVAARFAFDFGCYPGDDPRSIMPWHLDYLSLWYSLGHAYECHDGEWKMVGGRENATAMLLASEPLTRDDSTWLEVPEYSLVAFEGGRRDPLVSARMIPF